MIRLILTIALCVVTAAAAVFLTLNPGLVRVEFLGVAAEAPFALAMAILLLATFILVAAWWVIAKVWGAPDAFRKFRLRRKRDQGFDALERALIASAAGQGALAVRQAARAEALLDRPALSRLLSARAAEADGDLASAQSLYEAMLEDPRTRLVARRGLAAIAEARGDPVAVITHAREAFETAGPARWAFDSLFSAQVNAARWREAETTLGEGEKRGFVDKARAARTRAVLLTAEARRLEASYPQAAARLAERAAR
ncbi:MAG: heme biosynthesis protein HemY, partial [Oceanicaulis sp.]|nr:heme biosynthesis protein HemY [Oceanicaulis sp.]